MNKIELKATFSLVIWNIKKFWTTKLYKIHFSSSFPAFKFPQEGQEKSKFIFWPIELRTTDGL